ncbi:MAG TPA: cell division protein ZapB [Acidobacteriota bacterium]|nr:cell division protein ZapB [Acidobacteriota bacterium]
MTETKPEWEPTGLERFGHLEDKIYRVVEAFKTVRKENETLRAENQKLKGDMQILQEREGAFNDNLGHLQKEREELRERVEKALNLLATLEVH